ncbi:MAG TPA: YppG family protein [Bacillota bacterium]|nr:YppG family protein [Bacillota bacterium]
MYQRQFPFPPNQIGQSYEQPFYPQQQMPRPPFFPMPQHMLPIHFNQMPNQPFNYPPPYQQPPRPPLSASVLNQFQTDDGQIDINKTLATVGQLANTFQQVTPVIKQFGSIIRYFR